MAQWCAQLGVKRTERLIHQVQTGIADDGPSHGTSFEQHLGFNRGVTAGIEHLSGHDGVDDEVEGIDHEPDDDEAVELALFERVCDTVAHAHDRGIIHRDLKPENVMVDDSDAVYLMDWGLAKRLGEDSEPGYETRTGVLVGTPAAWLVARRRFRGRAVVLIRS